MTQSVDAFEILQDVIQYDLRPPHYQEMVDISHEAKMFHARDAEKQREKLIQLRKTETKEQQDQRVRLSGVATSDALSPVYSYVEQIWRTDGVSKKIVNDEVSESIREEIDEHLKAYYDNQDLHRYVFETILRYTKVDPNAWIIFDVVFEKGSRGENTVKSMYPIEVESHELRALARDKSNILDYIVFEFKRKVFSKADMRNSRELSDFHMYGVGYNIHVAETDPDYVDTMPYEELGYKDLILSDSSRNFKYKIATNTTKEVPAISVGAYSNIEVKGISEPMVWDAKPILDMMVKDNSLLQLTKYVHAFPKLSEYVRKCTNRNESGLECVLGYFGGVKNKESMCEVCKGTGKMLIFSEQDIKTLAYPDRAEDFVELSKLSHYHERPIDIWVEYDKTVNAHGRNIFRAVFSQIKVDPTKLTQTETATQQRIEFDKIYNKLYPFAERVSKAWELGVRIAYQMFGFPEVTSDMTYPFDFKMKTLADLVDERKRAIEAQSPYDIINTIDVDIIRKQYRNTPQFAADVIAFQRWKPWKDKSADEIAFIISSRDQLDNDRLLWEDFSQVVDIVKMSLGKGNFFSQFDEKAQKDMIYNALEEHRKNVKFTQPLQLGGGLPIDDEPEEGDE